MDMHSRYFSYSLLVVTLAVIFCVFYVLNDRLLSRTLIYFWHDISAEKTSNLMMGSSSVARLDTQRYLPCGNWLNRGLGNSSIADLQRYVRLTPLTADPPIILLYAGENDISRGMRVADAAKAYRELIASIRNKFPQSDIHVLGIKPSPARQQHWDSFSMLDQELLEFLPSLPGAYFHPFKVPQAVSLQSVFVADGIHLTQKGYEILTSEVRTACSEQ